MEAAFLLFLTFLPPVCMPQPSTSRPIPHDLLSRMKAPGIDIGSSGYVNQRVSELTQGSSAPTCSANSPGECSILGPVSIETKQFGNIHRTGEAVWNYSPNGKPAMLQSIVKQGSIISSHFEGQLPIYFEITAGNRFKHEFHGIIAVGLALKDQNANQLVGLSKSSFAVHSDDGKAYIRGFSRPCLSRWKPGDVIGMGVDAKSRGVYVTRNGVHMGVVFKVSEEIALTHLVPTVSIASAPEIVHINNGPTFSFQPSERTPMMLNGGWTGDKSRFSRSGVEMANQIFARFDENEDGALTYAEVKNIIMHTRDPRKPINHGRSPLPYPSYINFCRLTGSEKPEQGVDASQLWTLYEEGYGNIVKDWTILTEAGATRPELLKATSHADVINMQKTGMTRILHDDGNESNTASTNGVDTRKGIAAGATPTASSAATTPVDGGWTEWTECTHSCGWSGMQKRSCTAPPPSGGGKYCQGPASRPCNLRKCLEIPVWTAWSRCSSECGLGKQYRSCYSDTLENCVGESQRPCKGRALSTCYLNNSNNYYSNGNANSDLTNDSRKRDRTQRVGIRINQKRKNKFPLRKH